MSLYFLVMSLVTWCICGLSIVDETADV